MATTIDKDVSDVQVEYKSGSDGSDGGEKGLSSAQAAFPEYDKKETTRILWKIDWRLVPFLSVLYLMSFLDRSNIGNAKIAGMEDDLQLTGHQYNVAVTVFFIPYALLEVPSNIILKMMRPSQWIAIMMFAWGIVMTLMGVVTSYEGLVVARFFLGVGEAGFFPAAAYLLTIWYKRYEVQRRMAVLYCACTFSGAFSGLLAFALAKMDGVGGLSGWKWIFIIEGMMPIILSVLVYFYLPDSPATAKFLTQAERDFIVNRLANETGSGAGKVSHDEKIQMRHVKDAFADWKNWAAMVIYCGVSVGVYGFVATVPTVVRDLGYTAANAQLMTIPIYLVAMVIALIFAFWSDKVQQRTPFIAGGFSIAAIGFIGQLAIPHDRLHGVTYFFLFLIAIGLYSPFVCIVCLVGNNLAPSSKRAVGMALVITVGNLGGIVGSNIYIKSEAPSYPTGFGTCLGVVLASITATGIVRHLLNKENKRRDAHMQDKNAEDVVAEIGEEQLLHMGDKSPFYRYTL